VKSAAAGFSLAASPFVIASVRSVVKISIAARLTDIINDYD